MSVEDILAKLEALGPDRQCPVCGNTNWEAYGDLVFLPTISNGTINVGNGPPCLVMFCTECGNARFHSSVLLEKA